MTELITEAVEDTAARDHFAAVGRVASNWAYFEMAVDTCAMQLADIDSKTAACFTAQVIGPSRKFDALIALCGLIETPEELLKKLRQFAGHAIGIGERRNRVVHDPWLIHEGKAHRFEITAKKKLVREVFKSDPGELEQLADTIETLNTEFNDLAVAIYDATEQGRKKLPKVFSL